MVYFSGTYLAIMFYTRITFTLVRIRSTMVGSIVGSYDSSIPCDIILLYNMYSTLHIWLFVV